MKTLLSILLFAFLLTGCHQPEKLTQREISDIKSKANALLDDWHLAATRANFSNYFNAMDSISVFIGTDASENWTKPEFEEFSKPYFDRGKAWDFKTLERNIYVNTSGDFAWFDELLDTWMGICRGSGVIEKTGKSLKIKHYVLSVTIPNDVINEVIAAKKEKDSIFLHKKTK